MADRLDLHNEFIEVLGTKGETVSRVYFQPPPSVQMKYDAIRYELSGKDLKRANNKIYSMTNRYDGVYITRDPDSKTPDAILMRFQMCSFGTPYVVDNLYHFPFTIYY